VDKVNLELLNCSFAYNKAFIQGGAIHAGGRELYPPVPGFEETVSITGCDFFRNQVTGEYFEPVTIAGNGGAIRLQHAVAELVDCSLIENEVHSVPLGEVQPAWGGAIAVYDSDQSPGLGGLAMVNCLVVGNLAQSDTPHSSYGAKGGGIYYEVDGRPASIVNCTIAENEVDADYEYSGGVYAGDVLVANSILWGNIAGTTLPWGKQLYVLNYLDVRFSCVQNSQTMPGVANIWDDPQFLGDAANPDYRLALDSPCIDVGLNIVDCYPDRPGRQALPTEDLDGNTRIVDGSDAVTGAVVDMGCFEYQR
jgi:predicted outer membrane repeat protein